MDVLPSAIPEEFFLEASDECLSQLALLIDRGVALLMQKYLDSPDANPQAKARMSQFLAIPIRQVTFAAELRERGTYDLLRNVTPLNVSTMTNVTEMEQLKEACDFILAHQQLVRDTVPVRTLDDFNAFVHMAPAKYRAKLTRNRSYFYTPHAREGATGLSGIVRRMEDFKIMSRGLEIRILGAKSGRENWAVEVSWI